MKKRILSMVCAVVLTLALPLTALAAPSRAENYALLPSAEGRSLAQYVQARIAEVDSKAIIDSKTAAGAEDFEDDGAAIVKLGTVNTVFMPGVLAAINELYGETATVYDISKIAVIKPGYLSLACDLASAQDDVAIVFYNKNTGTWEEAKRTVYDGMIFIHHVDLDYGFFFIVNKGQNK